MPATYRPIASSPATDIFEEYAAIATVPLTIDWGATNKGRINYQKELPSPPATPSTDSSPKFIGRRGLGSEIRSPIPSSYSAPTSKPGLLVRRGAMRRSRSSSTDSSDSLWFAPAGYDVTPARSITSSPERKIKSQQSSYRESPVLKTSITSLYDGSTDTTLSQRSRVRIFDYDLITAPTEIHVGTLYEVISYIWETITHPYNIERFTTIFNEYAIPRANAIGQIASNAMSLEHFFQSTELHVHVNAAQKPRYTSLDALEITLQQDLVDAVSTADETDSTQIKAVIRTVILQQIGEYILNHILLRDGSRLAISPSIDLARTRQAIGGEVLCRGLFGGVMSYRWKGDRVQILLRMQNGEVYRIPERIVTEFYRSIKLTSLQLEELYL